MARFTRKNTIILFSLLLFSPIVWSVGTKFFPPIVTSAIDAGNINVSGNTISSSDADGDVTIAPDGSGEINLSSSVVLPDTSEIKLAGNSQTLNIETNGTGQTINIGAIDSTVGINGTTTLSTVRASTGLQLLNEAYARFYETGGSNFVALKAPASLSSDTTWTLPDDDGTSGQVLSTNGSGTLSWADDSGGSSLGYYDVNIGGANFDLGTGTNFTTYTQITNGSGSLTINSGSESVGIACTDPGTETQEVGDTTCGGSEGTEVIGIVMTPLSTTKPLKICAEFSHRVYDSSGASNSSVVVGFQMIATENNTTSILSQGKSRVISSIVTNSSGGEVLLSTKSLNVCGIFTFADTNLKRIILAREQVVSGTININDIFSDGDASYGQPDVHIYGYYLP